MSWRPLEHLRFVQRHILDFCRNPENVEIRRSRTSPQKLLAIGMITLDKLAG